MANFKTIMKCKGAAIFFLSNISVETDRVERVAFALDQIFKYFDLQEDSDRLK